MISKYKHKLENVITFTALYLYVKHEYVTWKMFSYYYDITSAEVHCEMFTGMTLDYRKIKGLIGLTFHGDGTLSDECIFNLFRIDD